MVNLYSTDTSASELTLPGASYYTERNGEYQAPTECDLAATTVRLPLWTLTGDPPTLSKLMDLEDGGIARPSQEPGLAPLDPSFWPTAAAVCRLYLTPQDDEEALLTSLEVCATAAQRASLAIHLQGWHTGLPRNADLGVLITL